MRRDGKLEPASWGEAFAAIAERLADLKASSIAAIAGDMVDTEAMVALKELMTALGSPHLDCRQDGAKLDAASRAGYLFNSTVAGIDQADAILLVGTNPRHESAVLNARIRKRWTLGGLRIASIGPEAPLTYPVEELGNDPALLQALAEGRHPFADGLKGAARPMLILGQGALRRADGAAVLAAARAIAETCGLIKAEWNGFNVLHTAAARVGGLEIGFLPGPGGRDVAGILAGAAADEIAAVYLLGADEIDMNVLGKAFVIYQGSHGDAGAHRADVILPGAAYTEKDATWVNLEGRPQRGLRAVFPPGEAREDWAILRALSEPLGHRLPFDRIQDVRRRMVELAPALGAIDQVTPAEFGAFGTPGPVATLPFVPPIADFYLTDPIARASRTMAECSAIAAADKEKATGTHG